jgi:hypothetical protein
MFFRAPVHSRHLAGRRRAESSDDRPGLGPIRALPPAGLFRKSARMNLAKCNMPASTSAFGRSAMSVVTGRR